LGQVYLAGDKQPLFLGTAMRETGDYSEATSEIIDLEIRESIRREYNRALAILREKQDILHRGARLLLDQEKLDAAEIKALMAAPAAQVAAQ
jgi:cell division protease FtsH